ncbi:hypothetical protein C9J03_17640 [Photobacterium gaetbulicola]|nr:hypothetical protein C9J03_17640 [Photobacterium gaetbulicola]
MFALQANESRLCASPAAPPLIKKPQLGVPDERRGFLLSDAPESAVHFFAELGVPAAMPDHRFPVVATYTKPKL